MTATCSTCSGSGWVDWAPGQQRDTEDDQQRCPDCTPADDAGDVHYPTTPVQCACGWRQTDPDAGSWQDHMSHEARAEVDSLRAEVERLSYVDEYVAADCKVGHRILIDDGDGGVYVCPSCALASLRVTLAAVGAKLDEHEICSDRRFIQSLRDLVLAADPVSLADVREPRSCRRCGATMKAATVGVLCDPPHAGSHDFPEAHDRWLTNEKGDDRG